MPRYRLQVYELHIGEYEVEADSPEAAVAAYEAGTCEADHVDNAVEYVSTEAHGTVGNLLLESPELDHEKLAQLYPEFADEDAETCVRSVEEVDDLVASEG